MTQAIAIIPARGGSQRIPGKNIKLFAGKPMIAHSIQTALQSTLFDRVVVSTDDDRIAEVARVVGAEVSFVRPAELADHHTGTSPVVDHALRWLFDHGDHPEWVCCMYATAPFIRVKYLMEGFEWVASGRAASAFAVTTFPHPIERAWHLDEAGFLEMIWPEHRMTRSQDLPPAYHDAGQFYWSSALGFLEHKRFSVSPVHPVLIPRHLAQDIDTPEDWERAEVMYDVLSRRGE